MILINGVLNLYCAGLGLLMLLGTAGVQHLRSSPSTTNRVMLILTTIMLGCDGIALCFFHRDAHNMVLYRILMGGSYTAFYVIIALYMRYVIETLSIQESTQIKAIRTANIIFCSIGALVWCSNCVSPLFIDPYTLRVTNQAIDKSSTLPGLLAVLLNVILVLRYAGREKKQDAMTLIAVPMLPLVTSLIGQIRPGLSLQYSMILASLVFNHFHIDQKLDRQLEHMELELREVRLRMTLERVKPHYIYNVLTSIYYLCEKDSQKAQYAVSLFSDYLRDALRNMERMELVPFSWEQRLIENYLKLEQLRFGDRLKVEYDIRENDFKIPPFTVQPLVENAVKHGLREEHGVTIHIESCREKEGYRITVYDDGVGFSQNAVPEEAPSGLRNIQELLSYQGKGSLTLSSEPGRGTRAVLFFPD